MAPSSMIQPLPLDLNAAREKSRLKKPRVEKLRRSRINGSIEQLKALLVKEFQRCQPSSKLEKADVLEMTVSYLRHSQTVAPLSSTCTAQDYGRGYSSCLKETLRFLGTHSASHEAQRKLLNHLQMFWEAAAAKNNPPPPCTPGRLQEGPSQNASSKPSCVLWRPWERGEEFGLGRPEAIAELVVLSRELRVLQQPQATL